MPYSTTQLITNVQRNLDDLGSNFYDPTNDILPSLQDGYNLVAALTESIETYVSVPFQSGLVYYDFSKYIPNYLRIFGIYNNNINRWMYPTSMLELYRIRDNWELGAGDPYWFLPIDYHTVALFPVQAVGVGSMTVMFKATADTLVNSTTNFPQLPQEHGNVLEFYSTDDLLDEAQEWSKALDYSNLMDNKIESILKVLRERSSPNHLYYKQNTY